MSKTIKKVMCNPVRDIFSKYPTGGGNCNPPQPLLCAAIKFLKSILCLILKLFYATIILYKNIRFPSSKIENFYSVKLYIFYKILRRFLSAGLILFYKN